MKDNTEITRESYGQIAPTYAQVSADMSETLISLAEQFVHLLESSFGPNPNIQNVRVRPRT